MEFKDRGNLAFKQSDWNSALELYTKAYEQDSSLVSALANRAACYVQLQQWAAAVRDCDLALKTEALENQLKLKLIWRKAVSLRNLGENEAEWRAIVHQGLAIDPKNDKLNEELQYIFIAKVDEMPIEFRTSGTKTKTKAEEMPAEHYSQRDFLPSLPLTYNGVLRLIRSHSPQTYEFWYSQITGSQLIDALAQAGVEPDTLDYFCQMITANPGQAERNREYWQALKQSPRFEMASFMANDELLKRATALLN